MEIRVHSRQRAVSFSVRVCFRSVEANLDSPQSRGIIICSYIPLLFGIHALGYYLLIFRYSLVFHVFANEIICITIISGKMEPTFGINSLQQSLIVPSHLEVPIHPKFPYCQPACDGLIYLCNHRIFWTSLSKSFDTFFWCYRICWK